MSQNFYNEFASVRFERTQPRQWRHIPFAPDRRLSRTVLRVVGGIILYACVFGVALWAIGQQQPSAGTYARVK